MINFEQAAGASSAAFCWPQLGLLWDFYQLHAHKMFSFHIHRFFPIKLVNGTDKILVTSKLCAITNNFTAIIHINHQSKLNKLKTWQMLVCIAFSWPVNKHVYLSTMSSLITSGLSTRILQRWLLWGSSDTMLIWIMLHTNDWGVMRSILWFTKQKIGVVSKWSFVFHVKHK